MKPVNRTFAVQDNAVQRVDVGALKDVSVREQDTHLDHNLNDLRLKPDEILHSVDVDASSQQHVNAPSNKKERRILKHELFIERMWRLSSTHSQTVTHFVSPSPRPPYAFTSSSSILIYLILTILFYFHLALLVWAYARRDRLSRLCSPIHAPSIKTLK